MELEKNVLNCVYRLTFPDGKYYVGKTKNMRERIKLYRHCVDVFDKSNCVADALREFGMDNVRLDILCTVSTSDVSDVELCLGILEIKYIREHDCIYPRGYNTSIGGELLGIPADVISTKFGVTSNEFGCKAILVYDIDGNFVEEYPSISRCAYGLGVDENRVTDVLNRMKLLRNTYMLREKRYDEVPNKILPFKPKSVKKNVIEKVVEFEKVYVKRDLRNAAIMYNKQGDYVGLFDNARKSRLFLKMEDTKLPFGREFRGMYLFHYNGGEIKKSLGAFTSRNLTTMFYDDILALGDIDNIGERISIVLDPVPEKPVRSTAKAIVTPRQKPKIDKYTLSGEYVCTYNSVSEASVENNVYSSAIHACAKKKVRRCGNFIYRYEGDALDLPTFGKVKEKDLFD